MSENVKKRERFSAVRKLLLAVIVFTMVLTVQGKNELCYADADYTYSVCVSEGYLALRSAKAYDHSNEIGRLYPGYTVEVMDCSDYTYWYVYSPALDKYGFVNSNYLISTIGSAWTVRVDSGYLALRNAMAYDASNEIGKLYTGETVWVYDASDYTYWYVYSPKHDRYGYVNREYLYGGSIGGSGETRIVSVSSGYLALRTAKAFDYSNEIGALYSGETVQLLDTRDSQYWYVYSPKLGRSGYVNKDYLVGGKGGESRTVSVNSGYLALRSAKAFDVNNEIGELYTGDTVNLIDTSDDTYWYVYSPKYGKSGYVNRNYLNGGAVNVSSDTWTVYVDSGYLALRTAPSFDASNEIGQLYSGETVQVLSQSGDYWYVYSPKYGMQGYVNSDYLY